MSRLVTKCGYWNDIFQPVCTKPAGSLHHVCTCPVAPETRGLKLALFLFGCFLMLWKLCWTQIHTSWMAMMPSQRPPMHSSVCLYFGHWPLQASQWQQPVSATIQHLSAVDFSDATVRSGNRLLPNHTFSGAPSVGAPSSDILYTPCLGLGTKRRLLSGNPLVCTPPNNPGNTPSGVPFCLEPLIVCSPGQLS